MSKDQCACGRLKDTRALRCMGCPERPRKRIQHGDVHGYWAGCRCTSCNEANNKYAAEQKLRDPDRVRARARAWRDKNKDAINGRRRKGNEASRAAASAEVRRRLHSAGATIDLLSDVERRLNSQFLVYALVDPRSIAVRYVGVSSSGLERPRQHGLPSVLALNYNKRKDDWIRSLHTSGLNYAIRVLEQFDDSATAHAAEPYWIHWMRSHGEHVYNITAGDDTQICASEATRVRMSESMKRTISAKGGFTEEHRKKISEGRRGKGGEAMRSVHEARRLQKSFQGVT